MDTYGQKTCYSTTLPTTSIIDAEFACSTSSHTEDPAAIPPFPTFVHTLFVELLLSPFHAVSNNDLIISQPPTAPIVVATNSAFPSRVNAR